MGAVLCLAGRTHTVALDRVGKDHGGLTLVFQRLLVGGIDLDRIMPATIQAPYVRVGHIGNHPLELGVLAKEVLAHIRAVLGLVVLIVPVHRLHHAFLQEAVGVLRQQRFPVAAPQDLDHIPAGAAEDRLQFLDDLAVAAYRTVQALEVAVHHPGQIVELLARGQGDRAQGLGLVDLAIADEAPDVAVRGLRQATVLQIAHEARLVDAHNRAEPHGNGRELPEIRHQPRVRVGRQALAIHLAAKVIQLFLGQASFQKGAGVDPGGGMSLGEYQVAAVLVRGGVPEVVEADVVERRRRGEGGDMTAQVGRHAVGLDHHGHCVPADVGADPVFECTVARIAWLEVWRNRVHIGRVGRIGQVGPAAPCLVDQTLKEDMSPFGSIRLHHGLQGIKPFLGLLGVDVVFGRVRVHAFYPWIRVGNRVAPAGHATGCAGFCYHAPWQTGADRTSIPIVAPTGQAKAAYGADLRGMPQENP